MTRVKGFDVERMTACTIVFEGSRAEVAAQQKQRLRASRSATAGSPAAPPNGERGYQLTFGIAYIRDWILNHWLLGESFETARAVEPGARAVREREAPHPRRARAAQAPRQALRHLPRDAALPDRRLRLLLLRLLLQGRRRARARSTRRSSTRRATRSCARAARSRTTTAIGKIRQRFLRADRVAGRCSPGAREVKRAVDPQQRVRRRQPALRKRGREPLTWPRDPCSKSKERAATSSCTGRHRLSRARWCCTSCCGGATALGVERVHVRRAAGKRRASRSSASATRSLALAVLRAGSRGGWRERVLASSRATAARADSGLDPALAARLAASVTHVMHCAASVELRPARCGEAATANVDERAARARAGAARLPRLDALVDVSTAYVTPHPGDGVPVEERWRRCRGRRPRSTTRSAPGARRADAEAALLRETGHPNTYTLTKSLAEHLLTERRGGLPLALVRPSIISAASAGRSRAGSTARAAFALFAVAVGTGRMRAVMARPTRGSTWCRWTWSPSAWSTRPSTAPLRARRRRRAADPARRRGLRRGARRLRLVPRRAGSTSSSAIRVAAGRRRGCATSAPTACAAAVAPLSSTGGGPSRARVAATRSPRPTAASPTSRTTPSASRRRRPPTAPDLDPARYLDAVCRGVYRHLLGGDEREVTLAGRAHRRDGGDLAWVLRQPHGTLSMRVAGYRGGRRAAPRSHERVTVDLPSFRAALAAAPAGRRCSCSRPPTAATSTSCSCSYLCFARPGPRHRDARTSRRRSSSRASRCSAGSSGSLHAFYLERGRGREDKALTAGRPPAGARGPRARVLRRGPAQPLAALPAAAPRSSAQPPGDRPALRGPADRDRLRPRARGERASSRELARRAEGADAPARPPRVDGRALPRGEIELGARAPRVRQPGAARPRPPTCTRRAASWWRELQARMVVDHPPPARLPRAQPRLDVDVAWLAGALARRGGRVLDVPPRGRRCTRAIERCLRDHFVHRFYPEAVLAFAGNPAVEHHVRRNAWAASAGPGPGGGARRSAGAGRAARALRSDPRRLRGRGPRPRRRRAAGDGVPPPAELVRRLEGAHLPDVEALYDDLAERGVLVRGATNGAGPGVRARGRVADATPRRVRAPATEET